jgi:hypothetical protein
MHAILGLVARQNGTNDSDDGHADIYQVSEIRSAPDESNGEIHIDEEELVPNSNTGCNPVCGISSSHHQVISDPC